MAQGIPSPQDIRREKAAEAILDCALRFAEAFMMRAAAIAVVPLDPVRGLNGGFEIRLREDGSE